MEKNVESNKKTVENGESVTKKVTTRKKSEGGTKSSDAKKVVETSKVAEKKGKSRSSSTSLVTETKTRKTTKKNNEAEDPSTIKAKKTASKSTVKSVPTSKKEDSAAKKISGEEQKKTSTQRTSSKSKTTKNAEEKKETKKKSSTGASKTKKIDENEETVTPKKNSTTKKSNTSVKKVGTTKKTVTKTSEKTTGVKSRISKEVEKVSSEKSGQIKINKLDKDIEEYEKELNINFLENEPEEKFDLDELDKKLKERKKVSKKEGLSIIKNSFYNLIFAGVFILFLFFCNYGFYNIEKTAMIKNINLFSFVFLGGAIVLIETAYKEDRANKCLNGIETLLMGIFTLVLPFILQTYTDKYINVLLITGITISIYYIIKSIIAFFLSRRDVLRDKDDVAKEKDENELDDEYDD